jgi:hypothetical protein
MSKTDSNKRYYEKHKDRRRKYLEENKDKIKSQKSKSNKAYYSIPEIKAKTKIYQAEYYAENKESRLLTAAAKFKIRKSLVDAIALHYGCKNPGCKWAGSFEACQLDFHHLKPDEKLKEVGLLVMSKLSKLANEINKCVVLCRNCHSEIHHKCKCASLDESMLCRVDANLTII